ncbi:MAG TPA: hypothetical protein PKG98_12640 [Myxococcota bacterium]|nr:hypothetical protein [Myxococcota bacterium]
MRLSVCVFVAVLLMSGAALADSIYGSCRNSAGERCIKSNHRISTSWNSTKGYPDSSGNYEIDFGGTVDQTVTVYCDGDRAGTVRVDGRTRFDVVCE